MPDDITNNLLCLPAHHSVALTPEWLVIDPTRLYRVTFGNPALALMAKAEAERFRLYPWLKAGEPQHPYEIRHAIIGPTHDPVAAVSEWLNANGAPWHERFQILAGNNLVLVFDLRRFKPADEVAA